MHWLCFGFRRVQEDVLSGDLLPLSISISVSDAVENLAALDSIQLALVQAEAHFPSVSQTVRPVQN